MQNMQHSKEKSSAMEVEINDIEVYLDKITMIINILTNNN